jgi:hypothetical protein
MVFYSIWGIFDGEGATGIRSFPNSKIRDREGAISICSFLRRYFALRREQVGSLVGAS